MTPQSPLGLGALILGVLAFRLVMASPLAAQDSLSSSLSAPIGDAVYSETVQTGPSSSVLPGGTNLLTPFVRLGISDPLGFLIESGFMSPYTPMGSAITSYANAELPTPLLTDPIQALRSSEYRNNRILMTGAGFTGALAGRSPAVGGSVSGVGGARMGGAASGGFAGANLRAPFAAGSSALAVRQSAAVGLFDPSALAGAVLPTASLAESPGGAASATGSSPSDPGAGAGNSAGVLGTSIQTALPANAPVPPPDRPPYGPAPGEIFPDVSAAGPPGTGFPDSTLGTAGQSGLSDMEGPSPLLSSRMSSLTGPYKSLSSDTTRYLNPTLHYSATKASFASPATPLSELRRRARVHAMVYTPGAPYPSPFEQRKLQRAYLRQRSGHRVNPISKTQAPGMKP